MKLFCLIHVTKASIITNLSNFCYLTKNEKMFQYKTLQTFSFISFKILKQLLLNWFKYKNCLKNSCVFQIE